MLRGRLLTPVLGIAVLVTAAPAGAATLTVSTTFDTNNPGDGVCSLREAIQAVDSPGSASGDCAAAAFGANTIVLGANSYQLGAGFPNSGTELEISPTVKDLTIVGAGEHSTTVNATGLHDRGFHVDAGASVTFKDLTITGADAQGGTTSSPAQAGADGTSGGDGDNGGAILNDGTLAIVDAAVINSHAGNGGDGGAGGASDTDAGGKGGAGGAGGDGGGIYNSSTGVLALDGATFSGDEAGGGGKGGVGGLGQTSGGDGGQGGIGGGGGAVANGGGTLVVVASTFRGNGAGAGGAGGNGGGGTTAAGGNGGAGRGSGGGGGILDLGGSLSITNSTFASNVGGDGGAGGTGGPGATTGGTGGDGALGGSGGAISSANATTAAINSTTLAGNTVGASGKGGAGASGATAGSAGMDGAAQAGGGIDATGSQVAVQDSLLALNSGGNCGANSVVDGGHNIGFGDGSCPVGFGTGDPNLGPIQDNGGPSQTISLGPGSAAVDAVPATGAGCQQTDERGVPRPSGSACDIGAYEVAGPAITTDPATKMTRTGAQVNATVTPNAGGSTIVFEYGTTTKYGSKWTVNGTEGVTPVAVSAMLTKLKPNTTYHYRATVTTMDGTATGGDVTFKTSIVPSISGLKIKPATVGTAGATVTYSDTQPATTTFVVQRKGHGRHRWTTVGSFKHTDASGQNTVAFSGKLHGRRLKAGSYRFEATPRLKGHTGRTVTLSFKVKS